MEQSVVTKEMGRARASVLSYLLKLNKCLDAQHSDLVQALSQRFNETLIDYISYGHFRFFQIFHPEPHQLVALDNITAQALGFCERYKHGLCVQIPELKSDLEVLALALETRFEIEDELTGVLAA